MENPSIVTWNSRPAIRIQRLLIHRDRRDATKRTSPIAEEITTVNVHVASDTTIRLTQRGGTFASRRDEKWPRVTSSGRIGCGRSNNLPRHIVREEDRGISELGDIRERRLNISL